MSGIREVRVRDYRTGYGKTPEQSRRWEELAIFGVRKYSPSLIVRNVDFYNLDGAVNNHYAGRANERLIFYNNTYREASSGEKVLVEDGCTINGVDYPSITYFFEGKEGEDITQIKSEEGVVLAEYDKKHHEVSILFDLMGMEPNEDNADLLRYIFKELERLVWLPLTLQHSWVHATDKRALVKDFEESIVKQISRQIEGDQHRMEDIERSIREARMKLKTWHDQSIQLRRQIEANKSANKGATDKFIKDVDLIAEHNMVEDVHFRDGVFKIYTEPIYAYASGSGERHYIGKMRIDIMLEYADVKFFNLDNPRRGYWTEKDPHPHVNGANGEACLGNVSTTIAELSSQNEIYALTLVAIDFLQNANTDDPAGATIVRWDMVDEEGNIIEEGRDPVGTAYCEWCDEHYEEDEMYGSAYLEHDENGLYGERYICENCYLNDFYYSEIYDEAVHNDLDDEEYAEYVGG